MENGFDDEQVERVWKKGRVASDRPAETWRKDECGAWMFRAHYGSPRSEFGWQVRHVAPGPFESVDTLRPFHRENGFDIANGRPRCAVSADRDGLGPTQHVDRPRNKAL